MHARLHQNKPLKGVNPVFPSINLFICLLDRTQPLKRRIYAHLKTPSSMSKHFYGGEILSAYRFLTFRLFSSRQLRLFQCWASVFLPAASEPFSMFVRLRDKNQPLKGRIYAHLKTPP